MLVVELEFPAGRYHATAWGRHVNEGEPEWPPAPYRLIRALYDVWKRKAAAWPAERVEPIFRALAAEPPRYFLPPASVSHTRSYLSKNERDPQQKTLIFDGFVVVGPRERVLIGWPAVDLPGTILDDLDTLLSQLNYLGRSESWVSARVTRGVNGVAWNCEAAPADGGDTVGVACPLSFEAYVPVVIGKGKKARQVDWVEALAIDTDTIHKNGLSHPPAMRFVDYARDRHCFRIARPAPAELATAITSVLYALESKVLPRVIETVEIAEQVRTRLMGIHKGMEGFENVSQRFSGRESSTQSLTGHRHAFYLPQDRDGDGRIDHILVRCKDAFGASELRALDRLEELWQRGGRPDIRCVPVQWGVPTATGRRFRSRTPFVPPRHFKPGRQDFEQWLRDEIRRECAYHELPEPVSIGLSPRLKASGREIRWAEFRRNRKDDPVRAGFGVEIVFGDEVEAPFALGYGCHFGLGQFDLDSGAQTDLANGGEEPQSRARFDLPG